MPGGEPPEGATAAHGAPGSQLPEGAAESALARLPRTESAAENAAESALAPIKDLKFLEGDLDKRHLPAEIVRERLLHFPKEARLPLWQASWGGCRRPRATGRCSYTARPGAVTITQAREMCRGAARRTH